MSQSTVIHSTVVKIKEGQAGRTLKLIDQLEQLANKMPGGRKRNIMKRQQEESSRNLMTYLTGQGIHHDITDTAVRTWPGGEPFKSPEKETGERARECGVCKMRTNTKKCTGCYSAWFCGVDCQRKAWPDHKNQCKVETRLRDNKIMMNLICVAGCKRPLLCLPPQHYSLQRSNELPDWQGISHQRWKLKTTFLVFRTSRAEPRALLSSSAC